MSGGRTDAEQVAGCRTSEFGLTGDRTKTSEGNAGRGRRRAAAAERGRSVGFRVWSLDFTQGKAINRDRPRATTPNLGVICRE